MKKLIFLTILLNVLFCFAQDKTITGVVSDDKGPLSGVSITIKDSKYSTSTGFDGTYSITAREGQTLVFSFIGAKEVSKIVGKSNVIDVILQDDSTKTLNEVVVTSLGIKKSKKTLTYAAQELKAEELTRVKDANLINTITGKIAGVTINRSSGGTGGSTKVVIRGNSSTFNNQPLYVIDGIPLYNVSPTQPNEVFGDTGTGNRDGGDIISLINPDDIESMSVLKGAAAAALYGTQGARGVILLNTKKGNLGKSSLRITSTSVFEQATSLPKLQNSYLGVANNSSESWGSAGSSKEYVKDFYSTGVTQTTSANFSGRTQLGASMISFANTSAKGIMPGNSLNKNTFSVKLNNSYFENKLNVGTTVFYANQQIYNRPTNGLYNNPLTGLYTMNRNNDYDYYKEIYEIFNQSLDIPVQNWNHSPDDFQQNPFWIINRNKTEDKNKFLMASLNLEYLINKWFKIASRYSYSSVRNGFDRKMFATTTNTLSHQNGRYIFYDLESTQNYGDIIANINTQVATNLSLNSNIGSSILKNSSNKGTYLDSGINEGLASPNWFTLSNFNNIKNNRQVDAGSKEIQSIFATASLGYKDYLFLDITGRNDWSSALVNTKSNSFFYKSIGLTNVISEALTLPETISFAKIRASYAEVGNDIPANLTNPLYTIDPTTGNVTFPTTIPMFGQDYKSELKSEIEIGTEWRFFNNRFGFDFTYYKSKTKNQLFIIPAPLSASSASFFGVNEGSIENNGVEVVADAKIFDSQKFAWKATVNFSHNKNIVKNIPASLNKQLVLTLPGSNGYQYALVEGKPFGVIQGNTILKDDQGRAILASDGSLQKTGFVDLGNSNPDFLLGFANNFKIGDLSFNVLIDGRFGGEVLSLTESINDYYGVSQATAEARNNGGVTIPTISATGVVANKTFNAENYYKFVGGRNGTTGEYIYDATNVVLREFSIGYTYIPLQKSFFDSASISLIGRNLFFFYKKAPFDPNISLSTGEGLQGIDVYGLPSTRSIGLNINLTF